MNGLSLFSGIGGIDVALSEYVQTKAYCEIDPFCQSVLLSQMQKGNLPHAPIWDDIRTLPYQELPKIDIIFGGFPCQDISSAGLRAGLEGKRSRLFFEIVRLAQEIKPSFIFLENVPAITYRGGVEVINEITKMGYDCRWLCLSAQTFGAPHKRERWFMLAYSNPPRTLRFSSKQKKRHPTSKLSIKYNKWDKWPANESPLLRMDDGLPHKLDRVKSLGNAVVPIQCKTAFEILMGLTNGKTTTDSIFKR